MQLPESPGDLYDKATLKWRRVTRAGERYVSHAPPSYGIDDSHLNVGSVTKRLEERGASSLSATGGEEALGHLRELARRSEEDPSPSTQEAGAEKDEFVCGALYSGSEVAEPFGAERRISTRARAEPLRLQMLPKMRGGARTWQVRMPAEEPDLEEVATKERCGQERGRGAGGGSGRDLERRAAAAEAGAQAGRSRKSKSDCEKESGAEEPRVKLRDARGSQGGASGAERPAAAETAACRRSGGVAAAGVASRAKPAKAKGATTKKPFGPERPPAKGRVVSHRKARKTQRNRGLAITALEGADLFRKGDWHTIEKFATMKLPMYSVAWAALKGYESCWKHWISFQCYARLDIFVEVSAPSQRRRSAGWLLCFVALLAYGCGYQASTTKKCLMAVRVFSSDTRV